MSHIGMSHVLRMHESCPTYERGISHTGSGDGQTGRSASKHGGIFLQTLPQPTSSVAVSPGPFGTCLCRVLGHVTGSGLVD